MYFTPRTKRQNTQLTDFSTNASKLSRKLTTQTNKQSINQSILVRSGSNKSTEKVKPIAKLSISIRKKKIDSPEKQQQSPKIRVNPNKYRINILSKMSSQQHGNIVAFGVSTVKGHKHVVNSHQIGVHLGNIKNILLAQTFDGPIAGKIIKDQYPFQLLQQSIKNKINNKQYMIYQVFHKIQQKITKYQREKQDNSGSCLASIIISNQLITVINAGCSQVICQTMTGSLLKLSEPHTTKNTKQMQRIIKKGGTLYQTIVNVPYQQQLQVQGPLRMSPSGLTYTRCLGRYYDYAKQARQYQDQEFIDKFQLPLIYKPDIKYIRAQETKWLAVLSQSITDNMTIQKVKSYVNKEMARKSNSFTEHHIAQEISRKIVSDLANQGVAQTMTAIIIFIGPIPILEQQKPAVSTFKQQSEKADNIKYHTLNPQVKKSTGASLTYLGARKSFVKQVIMKPRKQSTFTNLAQQSLKRSYQINDFSFNSFH